MKYPAYGRYKDSGIAWLGEVPGHWEVKRLKYLASINDSTLPESTNPDYEFSYIDIGSVNLVDGITATETMVFENAPSRARRVVQAGDIIVSTVRTYLRAIASIPESDETLIVSTGFAVIRPRLVESKFLSFALKEASFVENVVSRSVGVSYPAVNASEIGDIQILAPSEAEQTAIADFLDRETGRIDTLVAKKRKLVELLKEKRSALISRTVTRGLPDDAAREFSLEPYTRFRQSDVEWLGEVPEGWKTLPLKHLATVKTGYAFSSDDFTDEGVPVLRIGEITKEGKIDFSSAKYLPDEYLTYYRKVIVQKNDIVMAMTGATIGKAGRYNYETPALLNQRVCIFRPVENNVQDYIWYTLNTQFYAEHIALTAFGGAQPNISDSDLLACSVPVPPIAEQSAIATYLDRETSKIDRLVEKVETAINRLQECRSALITAAVTGKIDVREYI